MTTRSYDWSVMPSDTFFNLPEAKRQRLLKCAMEEFAAHDFPQASLTRVFVRAHIPKGSAYQYFEDKLDLYGYVISLAMEAKAAFFAAQGAEENRDKPLLERIRQLMRAGIAFDREHPKWSQIGQRAVGPLSPLRESLLGTARGSTRTWFEAELRAARDKGEVHARLDIAAAALVMTATIEAVGELAREQEFSVTRAMRRFEGVLRVIEDGIKPENKR
jgi:AcrR family transcriptional regulator